MEIARFLKKRRFLPENRRLGSGNRRFPESKRCFPGLNQPFPVSNRWFPGPGRCFPGSERLLPAGEWCIAGAGQLFSGSNRWFSGSGVCLAESDQCSPCGKVMTARKTDRDFLAGGTANRSLATYFAAGSRKGTFSGRLPPSCHFMVSSGCLSVAAKCHVTTLHEGKDSSLASSLTGASPPFPRQTAPQNLP